MKKQFIMAAFLLLFCKSITFAQCDKNVIINASKTEYLTPDSVVERTEDENSVIEISKTDINISAGDHHMNGKIKSNKCNWKTPFVEGKTIYEATFVDGQGNSKAVTLTIEGNGKTLLLLFDMEGGPLVRVPIDKFGEKNN